jgi:hypothetical protein
MSATIMIKTQNTKTRSRMGGKYSIRRPGMVAWATCETIRESRKLLREANNTQSGHKIIDNRTVTEVE